MEKIYSTNLVVHKYPGHVKVVMCPHCKKTAFKPTNVCSFEEGPLERIWECNECGYHKWLPDYVAIREFDAEWFESRGQ